MSWKAIYIPMSDDPPERGGFQTQEEAWNWVRTHYLCDICQVEYEAWKRGEDADEERGFFPSEFPACTCEWLVYNEDEED